MQFPNREVTCITLNGVEFRKKEFHPTEWGSLCGYLESLNEGTLCRVESFEKSDYTKVFVNPSAVGVVVIT